MNGNEVLTLFYGSVAGVAGAAVAVVADAPEGAILGVLAGGPFAAAWLITFSANRSQTKQHREEVQRLIAEDRKERASARQEMAEHSGAVVAELKVMSGALTRIETKMDERQR